MTGYLMLLEVVAGGKKYRRQTQVRSLRSNEIVSNEQNYQRPQRLTYFEQTGRRLSR